MKPAYMGFILILHYAVFAVLLSSLSSFRIVCSASLSLNTDKEALLSFKYHLSSESSETLSSWNVNNSSPCNWTGVLCNESRDRVTGLDLSGFGLTGTISPHIGNLSFLSSLELQDNQLTGTIPDQVGDLSRLSVLNMSSNHIRGAIPLNITMCLELEILDLKENEISGTIPAELGRLRNLEILKLGSNQLVGDIPPSISNLSSLDTLSLGTNNLGGRIPEDLGRLQNLKELDLTINQLEGTVPSSIYNITSLVNLAVASNNLWGEIPSDVGDRLPNLLIFNFCINKFTGGIPGSLHNLTNINVIRMAHNLLEGSVPSGLGNLPQLRMYNIGYNRIKSSGDQGLDFITSLTNSTHLNFLAIDGNFLEGVIPENIGNLSTSLASLHMGQNKIYGSIPPSISHLSSLALLNLSHNLISGEIPPEIGELGEMQELYLASNNISGRIPSSLGNLRQLSQLDLSSNRLVGGIPTNFSNFQRLLSMDLSNNRLNESIPKEILGLPGLSTLLNLSKNSLTGPLPQEVEALESVVTIDLSHNHLSGSIPESISKCKSLEELFMANNKFSGSIPDTLGEVRGLEILDLSTNQLTGSIPSSLQELQALQLLNLSFNNLEGVVPSEGVFKNLSRVHIEGNSKLCLNLACTKGHGRRFAVFHIILIIASAIAICFAIGVLAYLKKSKAKKLPITSESFKVLHQVVSYDDLRMATGNFNQQNLIGKGSFGSVYKGYLTEGTAVAIKVLDIQRNGSWKSFFAECEALRNVRHRNLVKLITSCSSLDFKNVEFLALVYDFMHNGSLEDWIKGTRRHASGCALNLVERLKIAIDVACAMDYLHHDSETPIAHCDLKPSNVLLDKDMTAKVGDFGLARLLMDRAADQQSIASTHGLRGSIGYIPPEYGLGGKPTTSGDVYSYGVMLLEMFTGKSPTHESFLGGLTLAQWVQSAFPTNVRQVVDPELLLPTGDLQHEGHPISEEVQHECLIAVIGVALSCTVDTSDRRISSRDALSQLKTAAKALLKPTLDDMEEGAAPHCVVDV